MASLRTQILRDITAIAVVALYLLPILWWGLSAFTPSDALLDVRRDDMINGKSSVFAPWNLPMVDVCIG